MADLDATTAGEDLLPPAEGNALLTPKATVEPEVEIASAEEPTDEQRQVEDPACEAADLGAENREREVAEATNLPGKSTADGIAVSPTDPLESSPPPVAESAESTHPHVPTMDGPDGPVAGEEGELHPAAPATLVESRTIGVVEPAPPVTAPAETEAGCAVEPPVAVVPVPADATEPEPGFEEPRDAPAAADVAVLNAAVPDSANADGVSDHETSQGDADAEGTGAGDGSPRGELQVDAQEEQDDAQEEQDDVQVESEAITVTVADTLEVEVEDNTVEGEVEDGHEDNTLKSVPLADSEPVTTPDTAHASDPQPPTTAGDANEAPTSPTETDLMATIAFQDLGHSADGTTTDSVTDAAEDPVAARVERLKKEYLDGVLADWLEDHPGQDPATSEGWAREMEAALTDFYETLETDSDNEDEGGGPAGAAAKQSSLLEDPIAAEPVPTLAPTADETTPSPTPVESAPTATVTESAAADDDEARVLTGWFRKSRGGDGGKAGDKNKRYFELSGIMIKYFTKAPQPKKAHKERGRIMIVSQTQVAATEGVLILHNPDRTWKLSTEDQALVDAWAAAIVKVVARLTAQKDATAPPMLDVKERKKADRKPKAEKKADKQRGGPACGPNQALAAVFAGGGKGADGGKFKGHVHGEIRQGLGVGGFTKTTLTPTAEAKAAIKSAKGKVNVVVLKIEVDSMSLDLCSAHTCRVTAADLRELILPNEPRYYFAVDGAKIRTFVYCCPDNSPRKPRMLYSTGKASAIEVVAQCFGSAPTATCEISEAADLEDDDLRPTSATLKKRRQEASAAPPPVQRGTAKPTMANPTDLQGSLSAFMANELGDKAKPSVKKKIVILPDSARS